MVQVTDYLAEAGEPHMATPTVLVALEQALPPGLRELIEAQLGQLTAEEQQVLEVGVWQAVFAVPVWRRDSSARTSPSKRFCERLARREQFLEERELETWPDGMVSGRYGFVMPCIRKCSTSGWGAAGRAGCIGRLGRG